MVGRKAAHRRAEALQLAPTSTLHYSPVPRVTIRHLTHWPSYIIEPHADLVLQWLFSTSSSPKISRRYDPILSVSCCPRVPSTPGGPTGTPGSEIRLIERCSYKVPSQSYEELAPFFPRTWSLCGGGCTEPTLAQRSFMFKFRFRFCWVGWLVICPYTWLVV